MRIKSHFTESDLELPDREFDHLTDIPQIKSETAVDSSYIKPATFIYPTIPVYPDIMAAVNPINSVLSMPIPGTKLAPEKFRGDYTKVKDFIQHYDRLLIQHKVNTHQEKCETITRYCSRKQRETIQNIPSYSTPDWNRLREDILKIYDADRDTKRYTIKDVMNFTKKKQKVKITDLAAWKRYVRSFIRVAGSLLRSEKLTNEEHATYFWKGISRMMRIRLENRLLAADPARNLSTPFSVNEINAAAEALLQRDRFDNMMGDSDSEDEDSVHEEWSSGSESSDSGSESDTKIRKKHRSSKKKGKSAKKYYESESSDNEEKVKKRSKTDSPHRRRITPEKSEVEGLIRQLNSMSNDDPGYGLTFYKAVKLDQDVEKVVRAPSFNINQSRPQQFSGTSYQRPITYTSPPRPSVNTFQAQPPPHMSAANSYPLRPPPAGISRDGITCYGCGGKGHGMSTCPKLNEYIQQGVLTRDNAGRVVKKDGSGIRRIGTETFIEAIERERRPQSHLITVNEENSEISEYEDEQESETHKLFDIQYEDVYAIHDDRYQAYAADRGQTSIAAKRKEVLDGVYPPPLKRQSERLKEKENQPAKKLVAKPIRQATKGQKNSTSAQPKIIAKEIPRNDYKNSGRPGGTPIAVQTPRFNPENDEDMIDDFQEIRQPLKLVENNIKPGFKTSPVNDRKIIPRKSAVSAHIDPMNIMNQLLDARVSLAVGEVLGVSRELSGMLSDSIKLKSGKTPSVPVGFTASFRPKTRGLLIKIQIDCDGMPIEAIIDTGSQLNIVSEAICKSKIRRPIDHSSTVNMNDANGGERTLQGLVQNVPLECGGVHTEANLYVGEHVPFQMLLGRPWQRGNFVSIDERKDGTYLLFKDPTTLENRHEIMVTPGNTASVDWDFEPSTWQVSEAPISYFVEMEDDLKL